RDLAIIATYSEAGRDRLGRDIKSPEDGGDPAAWEHHETAKEIYVDGMTAAGLTEDEAEEAFDMALSWVLGRAVDQCQADTTGTDIDIVGEADGGGVAALSSDQVANAKTIIGMAKGMAGENWEHAAVIGVMTAF